jgi:hypothetical protein
VSLASLTLRLRGFNNFVVSNKIYYTEGVSTSLILIFCVFFHFMIWSLLIFSALSDTVSDKTPSIFF